MRFLEAILTIRLWRLAFASALLLWASFPPLDFWPLAWIAPIPWMLLVRREQLDGRRPYRVLWLAGFACWMGVLHFMRLPHWATSFGWLILSAYFAFYLPLFIGLSRVAVHRLRVPVILAAPAVWTGLELARGRLFTGMSMACLGHTQYRWVELIQVSDFAGAYGVSFVVMFIAASLARVIPCEAPAANVAPPARRKPLLRVASLLSLLLPAAAMFAAVLLYGHYRMANNSTTDGPRIALIQGSIDVQMQYDPTERDRIFAEYCGLSRYAVERFPNLDLIVWPESMYAGPNVIFDPDAVRPPQFDGDDADFAKFREVNLKLNGENRTWLAEKLGAPLLLSCDTNHFGASGMKVFDSAIYVAANGRLVDRYDKMHLVMFGEYVPLADKFPWLQQLTPLPLSATAGTRPVAFDLPIRSKDSPLSLGEGQGVRASRGFVGNPKTPPHPTVRIAPNICYESIFSDVIRGQVKALAAKGREPDILVNLTNDGWFWASSELDLHLACGVFRAVECRKPFLIAANTGFSAWIDSDGRIRQQGPRRATAVILAQPRLDRDRRSWYLEHGDWFAGVCLAGCVLSAAVGWRTRRGTPRQR